MGIIREIFITVVFMLFTYGKADGDWYNYDSRNRKECEALNTSKGKYIYVEYKFSPLSGCLYRTISVPDFISETNDQVIAKNLNNTSVHKCKGFIYGIVEGVFGEKSDKLSNLMEIPNEIIETYRKWSDLKWSDGDSIKEALRSTANTTSSVWKAAGDFTKIPTKLDEAVIALTNIYVPELVIVYKGGVYTYRLAKQFKNVSENVKEFYNSIKEDRMEDAGKAFGKIIKIAAELKKMNDEGNNKLLFLSE